MRDDSLDDVTKYDAEVRSMKTEKAIMDEKRRLNKRYEPDRIETREKEVWNEAIEATLTVIGELREFADLTDATNEIRKLKK